jgi:hypothetical protein
VQAGIAFELFEKTFAAIRLRHRQTKGNGSAKTTCLPLHASLLPLIDRRYSSLFKPAQSTATRWRQLRGHHHIQDPIAESGSSIESISFIPAINNSNLQDPVQFKPKPSPDPLSPNTTFDSSSLPTGVVVSDIHLGKSVNNSPVPKTIGMWV